MMVESSELIGRLSDRVSRVKRLPKPWKRAAFWLVCSLPYIAMVVFAMGVRSDIAAKAGDTRYLIEQSAAFLTALLAAYAAFTAVIPGSPRWVVALPAVPLVVWLGSLGEGCVQLLSSAGFSDSALHPDWLCLPNIALVGAVPAILVVMMLRQGAPLHPRVSIGLGGLAAAAAGNFGLRFFHPVDASLMVLVWQFGTVALLAVVASLIGPVVHRWRHLSRSGGNRYPTI